MNSVHRLLTLGERKWFRAFRYGSAIGVGVAVAFASGASGLVTRSIAAL